MGRLVSPAVDFPPLPCRCNVRAAGFECAGASAGASVTHRGEPAGRFAEFLVTGAAPDRGALAVGARIRAEEPHVRAGAAQPGERVADPGVPDVSLAVDEEEVAAHPL